MYAYDSILKMTIFVKNAGFQHNELPWLIQIETKTEFECDKVFPSWVEKGPSYENKICPSFYGVTFEDVIVTDIQDRYQLLFAIDVHK